MAIGEVPVQDIWLLREGCETGPAFVVVYVQMHGQWYEAIRERIENNFSHNITANGLVSESCQPVSWLNKAQEASKS